jgi:ribose/xylose/arabinose/galactoside ABC-type transport system permease subunit
MRAFLTSIVRPVAILILTIAVFAFAAAEDGTTVLDTITAFSALQVFANYGLIALGVGLTMLIREFDISVGGMMSLAGVIAVMTGGASPWVGVACAIAAGLAGGLFQGWVMVRLRLSSVPVALGGLLTFSGLAYVITDNTTIVYARRDIAALVNAPISDILSIRSIVALGIFIAIAFVFLFTRIGRDMVAVGSDRRAARIAGVHTDRVLVGTFMLSGALAALSGALLSFSLATASPVALSDALIPAVAAAIIGGVSLAGGRGNPIGMLAGVLVLCVLWSGLNALNMEAPVRDVLTGGVLLLVGVLDAPYLARRIGAARRRIAHTHG